jgi:hypothetical protein
METETNQNLTQKKIALAQSEHASVVIELMKDIMPQTPIIAETEFKTLVNAITLDVQATMLKDMVDYLEKIRRGFLFESKE